MHKIVNFLYFIGQSFIQLYFSIEITLFVLNFEIVFTEILVYYSQNVIAKYLSYFLKQRRYFSTLQSAQHLRKAES